MILDLGKCPNHIMHESESAGEFSHKVLYNYTFKFIFESVSVRIKKKGFTEFPEIPDQTALLSCQKSS